MQCELIYAGMQTYVSMHACQDTHVFLGTRVHVHMNFMCIYAYICMQANVCMHLVHTCRIVSENSHWGNPIGASLGWQCLRYHLLV